MTDALAFLADSIWGSFSIALLVLVGLIMTLASRGIQFRRFGMGLRLVLQGALRRPRENPEETGEISPFQALTTAMAATIGNGNIAGVATAIAIGGPGAAFWMSAMAPLGMATKFAEAFLAVKHRERGRDGGVLGGPMLYLDKGAGLPGLGLLFALCASLGAIGGGNLAQVNSVALVLFSEFGVPKWTSGLVIALVLASVLIGGIKRIGLVAERLVPTMVVIYVGAVVLVLFANLNQLPSALWLIVTSAFSPLAATGGFAGATVARTISYGIRRGVISSEAGLGTAGIAHSAARTADPTRQGMIAMVGVFIDTVVVCMATALAVVVTGVWNSGHISTQMVALAFNSNLQFGGGLVAVCSLLFGFSSLVAWAYYGEQSLKYVFSVRYLGFSYRLLWCGLAVFGAVYEVKPIWDLSDFLLGLMMLPNVVGLILLGGQVRRATGF